MKTTNKERLSCFDPETTQERQLYEENEYQYQQRMGYDGQINDTRIIVIGNIYENPELLEE